MASNESKGPQVQSLSLLSLDNCSPDEIKSVLKGAHPDLAEEVNAELDRMRGVTSERLKAISSAELSVEHVELLKDLEAQYPSMKAVLERFTISTNGMPTWEQVKKGLTLEVLDKAMKLSKPTLLLVSPIARLIKYKVLNGHLPVTDPFAYCYGDENLWNGGKSKTEDKWRVSIVEGVQDVVQDEQIYNRKRTNYEMIKLWVKKYGDQGLDTMNDADTYLTLMMKAMKEGNLIDKTTATVLNGKNLTKTSRVAIGACLRGSDDAYFRISDKAYLSTLGPCFVYNILRLRGLVGVDVPEA